MRHAGYAESGLSPSPGTNVPEGPGIGDFHTAAEEAEGPGFRRVGP